MNERTEINAPVVSIILPTNFKGHAVTLEELIGMLNQTGVLWAFSAPKPQGGEA